MRTDAHGRPRLDWAIDDEARDILGSCTVVDRDVLWAVGAIELSHAWDFTAWPPDPKHFAPSCHGSQLPNRRWYGGARTGWRVYRYVKTATTLTEQDILSGAWADVAALCTPTRVGLPLMTAVADALVAREQLVLQELPRADMERRCYDLAAHVWDRLRPDWALIDRFDLAGAA